MKRIFVTILSILYLASAMGATVEIHYCMGKSIGANFVHKSDGNCRKCGMKADLTKGCCKDEHITFKTSDHQLAKTDISLPQPQVIALPVVPVSYTRYYFVSQPPVNTNWYNKPPPVRQSCPTYIRFRNIRI